MGALLRPNLQLSGGDLKRAEEVRCTFPGNHVGHLTVCGVAEVTAFFSPGSFIDC